MDDLQKRPPEIDYLSKDYASFRQLMLDHLTLRVPAWQEPSAADLGNVIVEVLAYAADYLSYYQDAVATEAYLGTARRRPSVKHHTRLLDYALHEGCNARAWVQVQVNRSLLLTQETPLLAGINHLTSVPTISPGSSLYETALAEAKIFETLHDIALFPAHNAIDFYTEEGEEVSLMAGSTSAVLRDPRTEPEQQLRLRVGDVLVFEEIKNSETGELFGVDPTHRHAIRITSLSRSSRSAAPVMLVHWDEADALPFTLPIARNMQDSLITGISIARGNIVLADYGQSIRHELLPAVPAQQQFRPVLYSSNVTMAVPYRHEIALTQPAWGALLQDTQQAVPMIALFKESASEPLPLDAAASVSLSDQFMDAEGRSALRQQLQQHGMVLSPHFTLRAILGVGWELHDLLRKRYWLVTGNRNTVAATTYKKWTLRRDLLGSGPFDYDYTVDIEEDRSATLRFGDNQHGRRPQADDRFRVTYRVGNGEQGNVRADTICHIISADPDIIGVRNPLAALGGTEPQALEDARFNAPYAFLAPQRAVTEDDYVRLVEQHPQVIHAAARLRWVGSGPVVFVYVQRHGGKSIDVAFNKELTMFMDDYRLAGHQFAIHEPFFVALTILVRVYLARRASSNIVNTALIDAFGTAPGAFFFPDNFTFGQPLYYSQLIARAMQIPGVQRTEIVQCRRFGSSYAEQQSAMPIGHFALQPLEIIRVANDPGAPQNGTIQFVLEGGL
jgi:hypothetical protein